MTHRELRVALAGTVAGILIGSAAIASVYPSDSANAFLIPDINARFHEAPDPTYTTKRGVNRRGIPLRNEQRNDPFSTVKPETTSEPRPVTVCEAVQASVGKMRAGHKTYIPNNVANTELLSNLENVLAGIEADYPCPKTEAAVSSAASSAPIGVNNHCENYPKYTARYTQCLIFQQNGKKFP